MLFAIDVENTHIHAGFFEGDDMRAQFSIGADRQKTADEYAWTLSSLATANGVLPQEITGVVIGSVVPSLTKTVCAAVKKLTDAPTVVVGPGVKTGFPIRIDDPSELGADIAADVAAVIDAFGAPAVIADFGTASVISLIDADGAYVGGSILPGIEMSLAALHDAELLPGALPEHVVSPLGKNSADCMRAGVLRGEAMAVCGFFELYKKSRNLPAKTPLIVSGEYADYLLPYLPCEAIHVPFLTLKGLCVIHRRQMAHKEKS